MITGVMTTAGITLITYISKAIKNSCCLIYDGRLTRKYHFGYNMLIVKIWSQTFTQPIIAQ